MGGGDARVAGEEVEEMAEGAGVFEGEGWLEEEGLVAGDAEAEVAKEDAGEEGDGVG